MKPIYAIVLILSTIACTKPKAKVEPEPAPVIPTEKIVELKTSFGTMYIWLYKETPLHRKNFLALADTNYFDGSTFHRIVPGFVIQGGDPNTKDADPSNDGNGGPGYTIPAEIIDTGKFKHTYGALGAARTNNPAKASSGSQFYIVIPKIGTPTLNGNYTVFGTVIKGMEVAEKIVVQPRNTNDRPITNIPMDINIIEKTLDQLKTEFSFTP
ncbi:MAG: peptidylprolyl isomerase [Bacteroidota bacterium]|nr:peptidylprolyl isomerase [Bacteroidota bacterium]